MALVIDGYNLLNSVGITGRPGRGTSLERSRAALLHFLAGTLDPAELPQTTVVFDAADAPPGLPRTVRYRGITVRFAPRHSDADSLIEELVKADSAPRRLTVVSSDHRVQRAARRRRARAVDCDVWYVEIVNRRRRELPETLAPAPDGPLSEAEVDQWLARFGGEQEFDRLLEDEQVEPPSLPPETKADDKPRAVESDNPFPPGYGDDLLAADPIQRLSPDDDPPA